jgi:lactoylglutathione lyase
VTGTPEVTELRLVVTAPDYEQALRFYRDVLGLRERAAYTSPGGRVTILEAGRATLELADPPHAAYIDDVEVGHRAAGHIRVAFEVGDAAAATTTLTAAGATVIAGPVPPLAIPQRPPRSPRRPAANPLLRPAARRPGGIADVPALARHHPPTLVP